MGEMLKTLSKKELALSLVCAVLVALMLVLIGRQIGYGARVDAEVLRTAIELDAQCQEKQRILGDTTAKVDSVQATLKNREAQLKELEDYQSKKVALEKQLTDQQSKVAELTATVDELTGKVKAKQTELNTVTSNVTKAAGAPKTLPAGTFTVGVHIPAGRYKITGSSNLISDNINIILGGKYGVPEYVTDLVDGEVLNCRGVDTFTPLEQ